MIYRRSCHRSASPFSFARRRSSRSSPAASRTKCIHSRLLHTSPPNRHSERNSESRSTNEHSSILPPGVPSTSPQRLPDAPPTAGSHFPPGRSDRENRVTRFVLHTAHNIFHTSPFIAVEHVVIRYVDESIACRRVPHRQSYSFTMLNHPYLASWRHTR